MSRICRNIADEDIQISSRTMGSSSRRYVPTRDAGVRRAAFSSHLKPTSKTVVAHQKWRRCSNGRFWRRPGPEMMACVTHPATVNPGLELTGSQSPLCTQTRSSVLHGPGDHLLGQFGFKPYCQLIALVAYSGVDFQRRPLTVGSNLNMLGEC